MKAYGIVASRHEELRTSYLPWPVPHFYVHPINIAGVAIEKEFRGERMVLHTQIRSPETSPLLALGDSLRRYKEAEVSEIGYYRRALRTGRLPYPLRWFLWWTTLNWSGYKKSKRIGTFGLTSYGRLGAEQIHPIGPLTTTLTFGPISNSGELVVKVVYDHRVTDGAEIARCLKEFEEVLQVEILMELKSLSNSIRKAA